MKKALLTPLILLLAGIPGYSMHIAEGFLPATWCLAWAAVFVPFLIMGYRKLSAIITKTPQVKALFAVATAFVFVLSSLKLPSVAGSSSHLTGVALGALLFGASSMSVVGLMVLLFQALLLAHGGITTLGANAFSMAVTGPFVAVWVFHLSRKLYIQQWTSVFLAAFVSDIFIYLCTSTQLSLAFQSETATFLDNLLKFMSVFAVTQIPLAVVEGFLTVFIFRLILKYNADEIRMINPGLYTKNIEVR